MPNYNGRDDRPGKSRQSGGGRDARPEGRKPAGDKPYGKKTFGSKPFGEKKPYGDRPAGDRPYGEKKPYGDRPAGDRPYKKPYGDKPYGERKPYGDRPAGGRPYGEKKPYGDRPAGDRPYKKPYGDKPYGERKPYGDRPAGDRPYGEKKPYGDRPAGDRPYKKPYGDKPYGERKPYGDRPAGDRPYEKKPYGDRPAGDRPYKKPYGDKPDGERKPYGDRPAGERPYEKKPYGDRPAGDRPYKKPYGDKPDGERKPYGDRPAGERPYEKKPYGNRPAGDKPYGRKPYGDKPYADKKPYAEKQVIERPVEETAAPVPAEKPHVKRTYENRPRYVAPEAQEVYETKFQPQEEEQTLPYFIMGRNAVREAIKSGRSIDRVLVVEEQDGSLKEILGMAHERNLVVRTTDRKRLDELCMPFGHGGKPGNHQGILAMVPDIEYSTLEDILAVAKERNEPPFLLLLDEINDPYNLGSMLRSAACAGVHGVVLPKRRSASVTAAVAKASAGAVEYIKVAKVVNLTVAITQLKEAGVWIAGAEPSGEPMEKVDLSGPLAIVIGNEGEGISRLVRENCDHLVSIPMRGPMDSLNASVAAAVLLFEKNRQDGLKKE